MQRILWTAILFSTFVYAGVAAFVARQNAHGSIRSLLSNPRDLAPIVVAAVLFLTAFWAASLLRGRDAGRAFFVLLALLDAVCLAGLVGAFRAGDWRVFILPWCLAMIGMIFAWPQRSAHT